MIVKNNEIYGVVITGEGIGSVTGADMDLKNSLELEKYLVGLCFATEDKENSMSTFLAKEEPNFRLNA